MNLFFDTRLGYLVETPGSTEPLTNIEAKAGDGLELVLQFGQSADTQISGSVTQGYTWTEENRPVGTAITAGLKEEDKYLDGDLLAGITTWTHDAEAFTYTATLSLNTTAIDDALSRDDEDDENDTSPLDATFEVTYLEPAKSLPQSSVKEVEFTIYHDILGDEGTPSSGPTPDSYALISYIGEYVQGEIAAGETTEVLNWAETLGSAPNIEDCFVQVSPSASTDTVGDTRVTATTTTTCTVETVSDSHASAIGVLVQYRPAV